MALKKRTELCEQLGISQAVISMAVSRGHLVLTDGQIDDTLEVNSLFIRKKLQAKAVEIPAASKPTNNKAPARDTQIDPGNDQLALNALKTKVHIKKMKEEYELVRLKKERLMGETLPFEVVRTLLTMQVEGIMIAWDYAAEDLLVKLSASLKLNRKKAAEIKTQLTNIRNDASKRQAEETKKSLRKLQFEMSNKRGKGEHD